MMACENCFTISGVLLLNDTLLPTRRRSFVAQRLDRIEQRSFARRIPSEEDTHTRRFRIGTRMTTRRMGRKRSPLNSADFDR